MLHPLLSIIIFLPILLISISFGRKILSILNVNIESSIEASVFGLGLGFGILSVFIFIIGILHLLYTWVIFAILILMGLFSLKELKTFLQDITKGSKIEFNAFNIFSAMIMFILAAFAVIPALAPSSGMDWDGLAYHLAIPKLYLKHHSIIYVPYISHSNFPFLTEMLYTIGLSINSQAIAKLFHYSMYIGAAVAVYALCAKYLNPKTGIYSAILFITVPLIAWEAGIAYTDLSTAFYMLLAFYALLNFEASKSFNWLIICGIACGFAFSTKVLAGIPIFVICILILYNQIQEGKYKIGIKLAFFVGITAILIGLPWYLKSYIYTGNPFYPFMYEIFGGKYWSKEAADAYRGSQLAFGMGKSISLLIMLPWNLVVNGINFFDIPNPNNPKIWGSIGMAFLGIIPSTLFIIYKNHVVKKMLLISAVFVITWFYMMQYSRYMVTIIPFLSIIAGFGIYSAIKTLKRARIFIVLYFALVVIAGIFNGFHFSFDSMKAALGIEPAHAFLSRTLDIYNAESWINTNTSPNSRIAVFDEVRCLYLDREYIWANPGHHEMIAWNKITDAQQMSKYFTQMGYDYFLINMKFSSKDSVHIKLINDIIASNYGDVLFNEKGVLIIKLKNEQA